MEIRRHGGGHSHGKRYIPRASLFLFPAYLTFVNGTNGLFRTAEDPEGQELWKIDP